jgi:hypothetical protein
MGEQAQPNTNICEHEWTADNLCFHCGVDYHTTDLYQQYLADLGTNKYLHSH